MWSMMNSIGFYFNFSHKKVNRIVTVTSRRKSRHSRDNVIAGGGKPLVEYSDVSSETLSSGPELGEITEDEQLLLSDGNLQFLDQNYHYIISFIY